MSLSDCAYQLDILEMVQDFPMTIHALTKVLTDCNKISFIPYLVTFLKRPVCKSFKEGRLAASFVCFVS